MRVGRAFAAGRGNVPFRPFSPTSCIFTRNMESHPLASSQTVARLVGNQLSYANKNYVSREGFNGATAPSFYGYAGIGYGFNLTGFQTVANFTSFTPALFVVPAGQATEKLTLSKSNGEPQEPGFDNGLQESFNAVPMPTLSKVPAGVLTAEGTDRECVIYQPSTGKMWEIYNLRGEPGKWLFAYGAYIGPGSTHGFNGTVGEWNGIFGPGEGGQVFGMRATGLSGIGGMITTQDVIEVLRGGAIKHALELSMCVTAPEHVPPATRNDSFFNVPKEHEGQPNPAYPSTDKVPEGTWLKYPNAAHPSEFGISVSSEPMATAIFNAIRTYGMYVNDSAGTTSFAMQWWGSMGTPYAYEKVNPYAGASAVSTGYKKANENVPESWADPSLPVLKESNGGTTSMFTKQPWQELELLEPFSS